MSFFSEPRKSIATAFRQEIAESGLSQKEFVAKHKIKKVANNTFMHVDVLPHGPHCTITALRLHNTDIIEQFTYKSGKVNTYLHDGGFRSRTTKDRMNDFLPKFGIKAYVYAWNGLWTVSYQGVPIPYESGMCIEEFVKHPNPDAHKHELHERKEVKRKAKAIVQTNNQICDLIVQDAFEWSGYTAYAASQFRQDNIAIRAVTRYLLYREGLVY